MKNSTNGLIISGPVLVINLILLSPDMVDFRSKVFYPIMFGDFAVMLCGLNLFLFLQKQQADSLISKGLLLFSSLMSLLASFMVGTRGAWLALPFLLILLLFLAMKNKQLIFKILSAIVLFITIISFAITMFPEMTKDRFTGAVSNVSGFVSDTQKYKNTSSGTRLVLWKSAIDNFKKYPFFGSGSGDFELDLKKFLKTNPKDNLVASYSASHSIFFEWLGLMGGVGFLLLLLCVFLLPLKYFVNIVKNKSDSILLGMSGIWVVLSHMSFGLTKTWVVSSPPNGIYVFFILLLMALNSDKHNNKII